MSVTSQQKNFLVFVISSGSITATYGFNEGNHQQILLEDSLVFATSRVSSVEEYVQEASRKLDILAGRICCAISRLGGVIPAQVDCIYTSPWINTLIHKEDMELLSNSTFNRETMMSIEENIQSYIDSQQNDKTTICNKEMIHIALNGYETDTPDEKMFKKITTTHLLDSIDVDTIDTVESVLVKHFSERIYTHKSFVAAIQTYIHHKTPNYTGTILFEGMEVRECMQFKRGLVSKITNEITRELNDDLDSDTRQNNQRVIYIFEDNRQEKKLRRMSLSTISCVSCLR